MFEAHRAGGSWRRKVEPFQRKGRPAQQEVARGIQGQGFRGVQGEGRSAWAVFGSPDDLKFRSSVTLFALASKPGSVFHRLLDKYFEGEPDPATLRLLGAG